MQILTQQAFLLCFFNRAQMELASKNKIAWASSLFTRSSGGVMVLPTLHISSFSG